MSSHLKKSYKKTLYEIQAELSPLERIMSRLVHNRLLWRLGEACETVFCRFTPMMAGFIVALTGYLLFITVAFLFNYAFSSMHILFLLFIIGYVVGVIIDYLRLLSKNKL